MPLFFFSGVIAFLLVVAHLMSASAQADCSNIAPSDPNVTSEWLETLRTERFHHIHHETKVSHLIKELKELRELFDMFKGNYVSSCLLSSLEFFYCSLRAF